MDGVFTPLGAYTFLQYALHQWPPSKWGNFYLRPFVNDIVPTIRTGFFEYQTPPNADFEDFELGWGNWNPTGPYETGGIVYYYGRSVWNTRVFDDPVTYYGVCVWQEQEVPESIYALRFPEPKEVEPDEPLLFQMQIALQWCDYVPFLIT